MPIGHQDPDVQIRLCKAHNVVDCDRCIKVNGEWWEKTRLCQHDVPYHLPCTKCENLKAAKKITEPQALFVKTIIETIDAPRDDPVNHPKHYTSHPSGIECIQITRHMNFNLGNAIKYIWRCDTRGGTKTIEDLKKARWYLDDEIKRLEEAL
jgi:hypothetical protein